jgi:hypothetical protein
VRADGAGVLTDAEAHTAAVTAAAAGVDIRSRTTVGQVERLISRDDGDRAESSATG